MNGLLRLRKDMPITGLVPFRYLLYSALLSTIEVVTEDETKHAVSKFTCEDIYDYFSEWDDADERRSEVYRALNDLAEEGLLLFDEDEVVYLGEFRGRKFFPFEAKSSLFDSAMSVLQSAIKTYGSSKSAKDKSRSKYIKEQINRLVDKGVENMTPGDFTDLHGYLYEVYTGGEVYILRSKVEHFQTTNMLKAYDKFTVFALIVESTLRYDTYRTKGVPTITNVACMKDDVFRALTKLDEGSKDYMRDMSDSINEDSTF